MILSKILLKSRLLSGVGDVDAATDYAVPFLNEIGDANLRSIVPVAGSYGSVTGYVVFYEDKNVYACPGCGHDISNTFSFCPNCGHSIDFSADRPLKCPKCDELVSHTFDFCPHCAAKLK